jgi:HEAT repeat protein
MRHLICAMLAVCALVSHARAAEPTVAELIAALKANDEVARLTAINYLGLKGPRAADAVPALTEFLSSESAIARAHAAEALGKIGTSSLSAVPQLITLMADKDQIVRRKAVAALREIRPGPKLGLEPLVKMLEDADAGVRYRVLQTLAEGGSLVVPGVVKALENERATYWALLVLREIGPDAKEAVAPLIGLMADPRPEIRRESIIALAEIGEASAPAVPQLIKAMDDPATQAAATYALAKIGKVPAEAVTAIRSHVDSPDQVVSIASIWALVTLHPTDEKLAAEAAEILGKGLVSPQQHVRLAAARALSDLKLDSTVVQPVVSKLMQDASEETVVDALRAFAALGESAVPDLVKAMRHERLRPTIAYLLGEMGPQAKGAVEPLTKLLADPKEEVRHEAIMALGKIGAEAKSAVPSLAKFLNPPEGADAYAAAYALGRIGAAAIEAKPALLDAMVCKDESVCLIAAWSLVQIHPNCKECSEKVLPILIHALGDPSARYRLEAANVLGAMGPLAKPAAEALKKAAGDQDPRVSEAAATALKAIGS